MNLVTLDAEWYSEGHVVHGVKKIHCISYKYSGCSIVATLHGDNTGIIKEVLAEPDLVLIGHNIVGADLEVFRRMLGVDFTILPDTIQGNKCKIVDTLLLSRRLNPDRTLPKGCPESVYNPVTGKNDKVGPHSLMAWSYKLKGEKPVVHDWRDQPIEVYIERCASDVRLTEELYWYLYSQEMK